MVKLVSRSQVSKQVKLVLPWCLGQSPVTTKRGHLQLWGLSLSNMWVWMRGMGMTQSGQTPININSWKTTAKSWYSIHVMIYLDITNEVWGKLYTVMLAQLDLVTWNSDWVSKFQWKSPTQWYWKDHSYMNPDKFRWSSSHSQGDCSEAMTQWEFLKRTVREMVPKRVSLQNQKPSSPVSHPTVCNWRAFLRQNNTRSVVSRACPIMVSTPRRFPCEFRHAELLPNSILHESFLLTLLLGTGNWLWWIPMIQVYK